MPQGFYNDVGADCKCILCRYKKKFDQGVLLLAVSYFILMYQITFRCILLWEYAGED